jgi:uncharacterized membrane protein HdeD (DUF308 family)
MVEQRTSGSIVGDLEAARREIADNWGWFVALGVLCIIVGILAIIFPLASSIAMKILIGWLLLITGIMHIVHCFQASNWRGFLWDLLLGVLFIVAGGWLVFFPIAGLIALTAFLAWVFILQGIFEIILAFQTRPIRGWGWILFSGIIAMAAGILIWLGLPSTATWALGLLAGINLITSGASYVALAMMARNANPEGAQAAST